MRKNSQVEERFESHETASGKWTFKLKATNGQVIGTSQTYDSESGCRNGIKSVAKNAPRREGRRSDLIDRAAR
ncbi:MULTISPECIES: YegP family protein [unclassified Wenzhouxiangella]|uniref:YegP family protein n=1 Tax=unclassified Wenzhouxiangella TaxID=2613841 RepID=UPI001C6EF4E9|nr:MULTISPECIES: YegP family protein [unclassified Wenzhouxiangella]